MLGARAKETLVRTWIAVFTLMGVVASSSTAQSLPERIPFDRVWAGITRNAPSLQAAEAEASAAETAAGRAKGHWLPRLTLDARVYRSDDPATSFMSLLESREVEAGDFAPGALNHPLEKTYGRETLGLDWALFEGGARRAMAASASKARDAKRWEVGATRTEMRVRSASAYAVLMALEAKEERLAALRSTLQETLDRYFIGAKSNPVGYSGLLGLKMLLNRVEGARAETLAGRQAVLGALSLQAGDLPKGWAPVTGAVTPFMETQVPLPSAPAVPGAVRAAEAAAESVERLKSVGTARLLPRVALFAEGNLNQGERAASHGYTAGAYVRWDLFDAPSLKAREETSRQAEAARARAEALRLQAETDRLRAEEAVAAIRANLGILVENEGLLEEQTRTARVLFKNGSINALQLVEVYSRRAESIEQRARLETEFAQMWALLASQSGFMEASHDEK